MGVDDEPLLFHYEAAHVHFAAVEWSPLPHCVIRVMTLFVPVDSGPPSGWAPIGRSRPARTSGPWACAGRMDVRDVSRGMT
jgi:hypothetical protein